MESVRGMVTVDFDEADQYPDWMDRLFALGDFLHESFGGDVSNGVIVVAYIDLAIGGLRLVMAGYGRRMPDGEVSPRFIYSRDTAVGARAMLHCEDFLSTLGEPPEFIRWPPDFFYPHGEARIGILSAMDREEALKAERRRQREIETELEEKTSDDGDQHIEVLS